MYWIAGCVLIFYLVLFLIAARGKKGKGPPGVTGWFYPMASCLYDWGCRRNFALMQSEQVRKDLKSLHPTGELRQLQEEYYIKKIALSLLVGIVGTLLGVVITYSGENSKQLENGMIIRGSYQEGEREVELAALLPSGEEAQFQVTVHPRQLSPEETEILYQEFIAMLPEFIQGENPSLFEVWKDLELWDSYEGYPFLVEWKSSRPELISSTGMLYGVEEETEVVLTADITYEMLNRQQTIPITLMPPIYSAGELQHQEIIELLEASESSSRSEEGWELPVSFQGESVSWQEVIRDHGSMVFGAGLLITVVLFLMADKDLHDEFLKMQERRKRLYPEIVQKLLLYLGAGMTVRAAFQKMAPEYEDISFMCRELQAGVSEGVAYEHWGKRIGIQEYLRLSTLLSQNLKKGNSTLLQRLKEEAERACTEQLQYSRKLSEEATTKLLLPMILLLVVVMLIIMLPAFSSMGM